MLGKRSRSVVGRLSELLLPGSSRSPLLLRDPSENKPTPNRCSNAGNNNNSNNNCSVRNFDLGHRGVGLGIVVALEKSSSSLSSSSSSGCGGGTGAFSRYLVSSPRSYGRSEPDDAMAEDEREEDEDEDEEDYTYVTFHGPRVSFTMVYHDQTEKERLEVDSRGGDSYNHHHHGFLTSCQLCGKKLHGQDVYIYRGEKSFCSAECRSAQILTEERSELCRPEAADAWICSPSEGQMFSTSIIAV